MITKIQKSKGALNVDGPRELNSVNAQSFHSIVAAALSQDLRTVEIDLAQTQTVDGAGLGALVALYELAMTQATQEGLAMRLTNPTPAVQQMIELTRLHHLYEVTPTRSVPTNPISLSQ